MNELTMHRAPLELTLSRHESVAEEERDEHVKPLNGIQLVKIQPGQRRSGQAGSESCTCAGRPTR